MNEEHHTLFTPARRNLTLEVYWSQIHEKEISQIIDFQELFSIYNYFNIMDFHSIYEVSKQQACDQNFTTWTLQDSISRRTQTIKEGIYQTQTGNIL